MSDHQPDAFVVRRHVGPIAELEPCIAELRAGPAALRYVRGDRMRTKALLAPRAPRIRIHLIDTGADPPDSAAILR